MIIIKILLCSIIGTVLITFIFYTIERFYNNFQLKKYDVQNLEFYIKKINKEGLLFADKIISPEFYIRCKFNFKYKNKIYHRNINVESISDSIENGYFSKGYNYLEKFKNMDEIERKYIYLESVIKYIKREIYNIELEEIKDRINGMIGDDK